MPRRPSGRPKIEEATRYVGLFDILGFSSRVENNDLGKVVEFFRDFQALIESKKTLLDGISLGGRARRPLGYKLFSDTMLVYTTDSSFDSLHTLLLFSMVLLREGLLTGIGLRGAIAKGEVAVGDNLFVGVPIVLAYRLEQQQEWLGCWVDDTCLEGLSGAEMWRLEGDMIIPYRIPLKSGTVRSLWAINWTVKIHLSNQQELASEKLDEIFSMTNKALPWDVKRKRDNTRQFYEYCMANVRELLGDKLILK
jgi:hypothetical protein